MVQAAICRISAKPSVVADRLLSRRLRTNSGNLTASPNDFDANHNHNHAAPRKDYELVGLNHFGIVVDDLDAVKERLLELGIEPVYVLDGGMQAWVSGGNKVDTGPSPSRVRAEEE